MTAQRCAQRCGRIEAENRPVFHLAAQRPRNAGRDSIKGEMPGKESRCFVYLPPLPNPLTPPPQAMP